jgi:hypothetical protein
MEHSDVMLYKATRCGITAPGRSAGVMHRYHCEGLTRYWLRGAEQIHKTRAEAAAACDLLTVQPLTWDMVGEELRNSWEGRSDFWLDAYRVVR